MARQIIGEVHKRKDIVIEWKISNFFGLSLKVDKEYDSPSFSFANENWFLKLYPNGKKIERSKGSVGLYLHRELSGPPINVRYSLGYKNEYEEVGLPNGIYTARFEEAEGWGSPYFLDRDELLEEKSEYVPFNAMTVVCTLRNLTNFTVLDSIQQQNSRSGNHLRKNVCSTFSNFPNAKRIGEVNTTEDLVIEWEMCSNFLFLMAQVDKEYDSPSFSFGNENWFLKVYPNGNRSLFPDDWIGYVGVYLHREISGPPTNFKFTLGTKTVDGEINPLSYYTYSFDEEQSCGCPGFLRRRDISERNIKLDPFTVVCTLNDTNFKGENNTSTILHENKILEDFKQLFLRQENCDVILRVKGKEFPAHKTILQARSPVFAAAFLHDMKEKATGVVDIEDCDPSVFPNFLSFLYCADKDSISKESVFSLFTVADKYGVPDLKAKCIEFIKGNLSVDTFCDTFALALQHSETWLVKTAADFFIKNAEKIIVTVKWQTFAAKNPTQSNELFIKFVASVKPVNT